MTQVQTEVQSATAVVAAEAAMHAYSVLRNALAQTSRGTVRDVFDRAVAREVAYMLGEGATPGTIAAFEGAAANVQEALASDKGWPSGVIWYAT